MFPRMASSGLLLAVSFSWKLPANVRFGQSIADIQARVGNYVFLVRRWRSSFRRGAGAGTGAASAIDQAMVLGAYPTPSGDLEYALEQLVDIAVRALLSGINDPRTANRILDRLGSTLCTLAG